MALTFIVNSGFVLEDLDLFGDLDRLPYSLDDVFWMSHNIELQGRSVSPQGARISGCKVFFGGPTRGESPTGTYIRQDFFSLGADGLRSVSPSGARFGFALTKPGPLRSVSPGGTLARVRLNIAPLGLPLRLVSPGSARPCPRFRGHGWITRAV